MTEEFCLSDLGYENTDCGVGEEVISYWKKDVKEFIKYFLESLPNHELMSKDFVRKKLEAKMGEKLKC